MALVFFLAQVFVISFSGALQPGPVTATTFALGPTNRYAGILIAIGHAIVEFPLIILLIYGLDTIFKATAAQIVIGLVGGALLVFMGVQMFFQFRNLGEDETPKAIVTNPVLAGILLSATNPYFIVWWATVGLALALRAKTFGVFALPLFAIAHWITDAIWLQALSWASCKGSSLISNKTRNRILVFCALAMFGFGIKFIFDSGRSLLCG